MNRSYVFFNSDSLSGLLIVLSGEMTDLLLYLIMFKLKKKKKQRQGRYDCKGVRYIKF